MNISFGTNTNISSAKFIPYLYDRIKSIILSFTNTSLLSSDVDNILIPCDADGSNPILTNSNNTFKVFYGGINQTSNWVIDILEEVGVTTTQVGNTISISSVSLDEGEYTVRAIRPDYTTITKTVKVYKAKLSGQGLDGADGLGWTSGSYNPTNGIVTFSSDDGLGFQTGDLRGADGADGLDGAGGVIQNINLSLQPLDEGGNVAGNPRGNRALDLQTSRQFSTAVASGNYSIALGVNNTASQSASVAIGVQNINNGDNTIVFGNINEVTGGSQSFIGGGKSNVHYGVHTGIIGSFNVNTKDGTTLLGNGGITTTNGEIVLSGSTSPVQKSTFILEKRTNATGWTTMVTLGRDGSQLGEGIPGRGLPENIKMANSTAFSGFLDFTAIEVGTSLNVYRQRQAFTVTCSATGVVTVVISTRQDSNGDDNDYYHTNAICGGLRIQSPAPGPANEILIEANITSANPVNSVCLVEGIVMDI